MAAAVLGAGVAGCGGGGRSEPTVAQARSTVQTWLKATSETMSLKPAGAYRAVTTGAASSAYAYVEHLLASTGRSPGRIALDDLTVEVPCRSTPGGAFVALADTSLFTLGSSVVPSAMVFTASGSGWRLAAFTTQDGSGPALAWPTLCRAGSTGTSTSKEPSVVPAGQVGSDLAAVFNRTWDGSVTAARLAPFSGNGFTEVATSLGAVVAESRADGVDVTYSWSAGSSPAISTPLAGGGQWVFTSLSERVVEVSAHGLRSTSWPGGNPVPTEPARTLHRVVTTYPLTYSVVDPAKGLATVDGFLGYPSSTEAT